MARKKEKTGWRTLETPEQLEEAIQKMARQKQQEEELPKSVTNIDDLKWTAKQAVAGFVERWMPMPRFDAGVEVMDVGQLRDAMGLRVSDSGDPWPSAEKFLLEMGFCWHWLGDSRVMFLREKDEYSGTSAMAGGDDGWANAEEWDDE